MMYATAPVGVALRPRRLGVAYVWWLVLGTFGAHRFYVRSRGVGKFMLIFGIISVSVTALFGIGVWSEYRDLTGLYVGVPFFGIIWLWDIVDLFLMPRLVRAAPTRGLARSAPETHWPNSAGFIRGGYWSADMTPQVTGAGLRPHPDDVIDDTIWQDPTGRFWRAIHHPHGRYGRTSRIWLESWPVRRSSFVWHAANRIASVAISVLATFGLVVEIALKHSEILAVALPVATWVALLVVLIFTTMRSNLTTACAFPEVPGRAEAKDWPDPAGSLKRARWSGVVTGRKIPPEAERGWDAPVPVEQPPAG